MGRTILKILGVVLVLYSLIANLSTPLKQGIVDFSPAQLSTGEQKIHFRLFPKDTSVLTGRFFLKSGKAYIPLQGHIHHSEFSGTVVIPDTLPQNFLSLVGQVPERELFRLPQATFVKGAVKGHWHTEIPVWNTVEDSTFSFPFKTILYQTIRNLNLHVPMWFAMMAIMLFSLVYSIRFLSSGDIVTDLKAQEAAKVGLFFSFVGIATGAFWAKFTWGSYWVNDPKLNGAAISTLVYLAYFVLRSSVKDLKKRGRLGAIYNIFAFVMMLVFIMVLPRLTDSLHPGNGGNPAFSQYDLDNNLRKVFYPAVIGWILMGSWLVEVKSKIAHVAYKIEHED